MIGRDEFRDARERQAAPSAGRGLERPVGRPLVRLRSRLPWASRRRPVPWVVIAVALIGIGAAVFGAGALRYADGTRQARLATASGDVGAFHDTGGEPFPAADSPAPRTLNTPWSGSAGGPSHAVPGAP